MSTLWASIFLSSTLWKMRKNWPTNVRTSIPTGHAKTVRCVACAPSGQTFATASFDANIAVWEQEGGTRDEDDFGGDDDGEKGEWELGSAR